MWRLATFILICEKWVELFGRKSGLIVLKLNGNSVLRIDEFARAVPA